MFEAPPPRRTTRNLILGAGAIVLLVIGLWFGGHPSWLPSPLRSAFVGQTANQKLENQVYGLLTHDYYKPLNRTKLVNAGLAGAVASLDDPYTTYYDPANYHAFQVTETNPQDDGGIGVGIAGFDHGLVVSEVYPNTPAAKAGVLAGDVIVAAAGHSFTGLTEAAAARYVRGPAGSAVSIRVRRGHRTRTLEVTRANILIPVASSRLLHYHGVPIGYVDLQMFSDNSGAEVRAQVQKMRKAGARAIILDLRDNGGGLIEQAVDTASVFIQSGTIVSTDGRASPRQVYFAQGNAIPAQIPLVVLVNSNTASSAEIVTGALKVTGRATVVGTHTYGKGVFQEDEPLINGGALKFTIGHFYLPNGQNLGGPGVTRGHGIIPNVYAAEPSGEKVDHQLQVAERVAAAKLR